MARISLLLLLTPDRMRRPPSNRYDIVTSAAAWSQIGTLDARSFQRFQAELDKLAWSAGNFRAQNVMQNRMSIATEDIQAQCDLDHVARRIVVLSIIRVKGQDAREKEPTEKIAAQGQDEPAGESSSG